MSRHLRVKVAEHNELMKKALGIKSIDFRYYRQGRAQWMVTMNDARLFPVSTAGFGTESTVLRMMAKELAKLGKPVEYPR